jgi:hypothetical protein
MDIILSLVIFPPDDGIDQLSSAGSDLKRACSVVPHCRTRHVLREFVKRFLPGDSDVKQPAIKGIAEKVSPNPPLP